MPHPQRSLVLSSIFFLSLLWSPVLWAQALGDTFTFVEPSADNKQETESISNLIWITFVLTDEDAPREAHPITGRYHSPPVRDSWTTPCLPESPTSVGEGLPIGWQSPQPGTSVRSLDAVTCERYLDLRVSGTVGGHHMVDRVIRWQPGLGSTYQIGIPREGTETFEISFPEIITAGDWVYTPKQTITIQPTPGIIQMVVEVPLERYAQLIFRRQGVTGTNITETLRVASIQHKRDEAFVKPEVHSLRAPQGYEFLLVDLKPNGHAGGSFPRGMTYTHLDVHFQPGWTYAVTLRKRPGKLTSR